MAVFLPIQQQSILAGICNKHFLTLVCSVSPTVIGKAARPVALLAGCSGLLLGLITQLSTFAMATDYTTTQTTSLNDGDTITTTADGTAGYGWVAQNGATLTAPGNNVITTNGIAAYGIVLSSPDGAASITATGTKIITIKDHSDAIFATNTGTITLKGVIIDAQGASSYGINISSNTVGSTLTTDDKTTITAMGTGVSGFGNIILTGTQVNAKGDAGIGVSFFSDNVALGALTQVIKGNAVIKTTGNQASGVWSGSRSTQVPVVDDGVSVQTIRTQSYGVVANVSASLQVNAATVVTYGENADGARAMFTSKVTLNGTHVTTHGDNAAGAAVGNAPAGAGDINNTITITGATLTTLGLGSHAVQIYGESNDIKMDAATTLSTTNDGSHAISLQDGASKTYDIINPADDTLSQHISVLGDGSAAFNAQSGGVLSFKNITITGVTLGENSWTAIAEDGGALDFENVTGIASVWARGSTDVRFGYVTMSGATIAVNTKVRVDAYGFLDIKDIGDKTDFTFASLEGNGGTVTMGDTNLTLNGNAETTYAGLLTGTGSLIRGGTIGSTTLTADNSAYTAAVSVTGGSLYVNGKIGGSASVTGGVLGGTGTIGGDVAIAAGGSLEGRQGQVLTVQGKMTLDTASQMNVTLGAPDLPGAGGLFNVAGDLTLAGTLNITDLGGFAPGIYRIIDYGGTLTGTSMVVGQVPEGTDATQMSIQTAVNHQVNLVNMNGADLNYWDGDNVANHGNGSIDGGNGTWNKSATNTNWTDMDGTLHGVWSDGQYAIFTGTAGTVTVDNSGGGIVVDGMQFAVDGYQVKGDAITLQDGEAIISVGSGNPTGSSISATIASELKGTGSLTKMDYGTLVLSADNSYTGGTTVTEGTLQLGNDSTTGSVQGDITNNAALAVKRSDTYTLSGKISGSGALAQNGSGTLILTADNSYTGGTTINAGTLQLGTGGTSGSIKGNVTNNGILAVNRSDKVVLDGAISGTGALQQNGAGTTVLSGDSSYSGTTTINAGTLQIGNGGTTGSIAGDVTNNGTLSFNRSNQLIFAKSISGTGSVTQDGAGTTLMTDANAYTGATRVNAGTLQQKMHGSFSAASDYYVAANATLDNGGYKTTLKSLDNSGTVNFGTNPGAVVTVTGNYTGHNGIIIMNAELNGDDSKTDILQVGGNTSGTTTVKVVNSGGPGAQTKEGIKIIDVTGSSTGTFTLAGDYKNKDGQQAVVGGAYVYSLYSGSVSEPKDGQWYLRSALKDGTGPALNPGIPLYQSAGAAMQALNKLPTLQQRVGNRYWSGTANPVMEQGADALGTPYVPANEAGVIVDNRGIWGRIEGAHNRLEADRSTTGAKQDIDTFIMQAGLDGQLTETETGRLIGGFTAQYGKANSDVFSPHGEGKIDTSGWGVGGTLTWYSDNGFYLDTQAQAMWYDSDLNSYTADKSLTNGNKGFGYGLSAELGKRVDIDSYWSLTPQAQLTWSSVQFDTFNDAWGASVESEDGNSLNARLGLSVDYRTAWADGNGQITRTNLYGIANLYQEFMSGNKVTVAGVDFDNGNDKTWGGLGLGGTYAWADDKYALYGEGSINTSLNNFADSYSVKGTVGLRVKW